ncbi:MAG: 2-isopropylmalate synthase [Christensenellales bacterium]|jgi:isopropylmalate/homocitrate/citramalate synthase
MDNNNNKAIEPEVRLNIHSNLLEENIYHYELQDVSEPNLYRRLFDYDSIPKTSFNHTRVPMNMPADIWMTDTTFRDGQQSRSPFTVKQIVDLFQMMSRLGGENGLIRQSEFFIYTENDRTAVRKCQELGLKFPEVTTWIRATENDFKLVKEMNVAETGILVSCSDYHIFKKMGLNRRQAMDKYLGVVKSALSHGIRPRCHLEDITRADFYGFVAPFVLELQRLSKESGIPIKIRACDTMGYGVSYPGVSLPRSVQGIIYGLRKYSKVPGHLLEWHGHNDFYKVVTNAATAWLYGCSAVNCSLLGIGERTGNCPLEAMAVEYASLRGTTDGMDLSVITEIARYFEKELDYEIPPRTPFVGRNFNSTRAGIHADGMLKDEEIYNIFNTAKILNRPATVAVDSHSGLAGIAHWMNAYYGLRNGEAMDKKSPIVSKIKELVDEEYRKGRNTVMGDDELDAMFSQCDSRLHKRIIYHLDHSL